MLNPRFFAEIIGELDARGVKRSDLAKAMGLKENTLSQYKRGRAFPADDKLPILARFHGGYTPEQLKAYKYGIFLQEEHGVDPLSVMQMAYPNHEIAVTPKPSVATHA